MTEVSLPRSLLHSVSGQLLGQVRVKMRGWSSTRWWVRSRPWTGASRRVVAWRVGRGERRRWDRSREWRSEPWLSRFGRRCCCRYRRRSGCTDYSSFWFTFCGALGWLGRRLARCTWNRGTCRLHWGSGKRYQWYQLCRRCLLFRSCLQAAPFLWCT